ncbi:MAG: hypothetical protein ACRD68_01555 [Pyrinomonadaceae bacterium]
MDTTNKVKKTQGEFPAEDPQPVEACPPPQSAVVEEPEPEEPVAVAEAPAEEKPKAPKKTWVKIKLVDMRGKPIPGERYRIKVPNVEQPYEGTLDSQGEAACYDLDPGTCKVTFPDLDEEAWEEA